ncbi:hypothetical protein [Rhodopila sp.]|uniref:hypothetical protein n=1 Tax=Rhodopila sp. TaxID=2480087 RepID=UPI003D0A916E
MRRERMFPDVIAWAAVGLLSGFSLPAFAQTAAPAPAPAWPHVLTINGANVVVYQPQAIDWPEHETLTTREAIAITPANDKTAIVGTTEISFSTQTDATTGDVILSNGQLLASHFPALDTAQATRIEAQIKLALPNIKPQPVALQSVLLSLTQQAKPDNVALNNDPPTVFYSAKPASLVVFDGEPVLAPVGKTALSFAVNTNWEIFTDDKGWYLLNNGSWMGAAAYTGPWDRITKLPPAFSAIPADPNFAAARKAIPPPANGPAAEPAIFVSTKPAEIIVTDGAPQFAPVAGTGLQSVKNTNSVLFFEPSSGRFFLQASGRWFSSHGLDGPWSFATDSLPPDFALIPPDGPQAPILTSVPGTTQAQLAVLQAQVPRQATLKTESAKLAVTYAGQPQFKPVPGTAMRYAVNTPFEVIETGGKYYVCYQGAWFVGPSPAGPWVLAASVPPVIYTIPPSSPLYNVTYVKVYGATPVAVTYGYTSGYMMGFVTAGVVVYGTGYYYPPVVIPGRLPIYYPYPYSYVGNVAYNTTSGAWVQGGTAYGRYGGVATGGSYYNPTTGAYGRGGSIYGPNGGVAGVSYYNPSTGGYARGSASWNANGGSAQGSYYNPRTGVSGSTNQNANPYARWGSSTMTGPNQTVRTESGSNARGSAGGFTSSTGAQGAGYRGVNGNSGGAVKTQSGDVYAGHDGNAYQHTSNGWSKWSNGGWQPVNPPSTSTTSGNRSSTNTPAASTASTNRSSTGTASTGTASTGTASTGTSPTTRQQTPRNGSSVSSAGGTSSLAQSPQAQQRSSTGQSQRNSRQSMDSGSYQQLEQDRGARSAGTQRRFGGGGGGGGGGGRFRRG